jgi:hypothetical protein
VSLEFLRGPDDDKAEAAFRARTRIAHMVSLLHRHHRVEAALIADLRATNEMDRQRKVEHDQLEDDLLYAMAAASDEEILAAIDQYEADGGYL